MKISEINFRDVDHKWIGIENKKNCKKIAKMLKNKELIAPIFGYFYIDEDYGITLKVVGNIEVDGHKKLYINALFLDEDYIIDYDFMNKIKLEFEILDDIDISSNIEGAHIIENKLQYKNINNILETRSNNVLDKFRDDKYPDDIEVELEHKEDEIVEHLWVTIEGIMDTRPDLMICKLNNSSEYDDSFKEGEYVAVKYYEDDDAVRIYGHLKKRTEE